MKSKLLLFLCVVFLSPNINAQIKLIVRADDMGSFRASNLAVIDAYQNGIARTTEVMVPCSWFNDAAELLKANPGLDVGLHMVLNSEWLYYRWRPLTSGKTIIDKQGYFHQTVWGGSGEMSNLGSVKLDMTEVEAEFRAQLAYALKMIPQISHISEHMYFGNLKPELSDLIAKIAAEYGLGVESGLSEKGVQAFTFPGGPDFASRKSTFISALNALIPGTYTFLAHPCVESIELSLLTIDGKPTTTGAERVADYKLFTDPDVMKVIKDKNIELINYKNILLTTGPSAPTLTAPTDSTSSNRTSIDFTWTSSYPAVQKYQIDISTSDKFEASYTDSTLVDTKLTLTRIQLPKSRSVFWRVRAKNSIGWGTYSKTFRLVYTLYSALKIIPQKPVISAYFNSSMRTINYTIPENKSEPFKISLNDMKGNTVLVKTKQEENETGSLNVKNLKSGVYIISIQNSVKKYNQKIIIE